MLVRYTSRQEINAFQRQLNHLFQDTRVPFASFERAFVRVPAAEINETEDAIHLKLELPGIEAKDLDVQVTENAVAISGDRKSENKTEDKGRARSDSTYDHRPEYSQRDHRDHHWEDRHREDHP